MSFNHKLGAKGNKRWIVTGDYRPLYRHLRFFSGVRAAAEQVAMWLSPTPPIVTNNPILPLMSELRDFYPELESLLLYDTSDYKETLYIGVVQLNNGKKYFIKRYKDKTPLNTDSDALFTGDDLHAVTGEVRSDYLHEFPVIEGQILKASDEGFEKKLLATCIKSAKNATNHRCPAHGDMNRLNVLKKDHDYYLIDFEQYGNYSPFYDWFHYHLKEPLYKKNQSLPEIKRLVLPLVDQGINHSEAIGFLEQYLVEETHRTDEALAKYTDPQLTVKHKRLAVAEKQFIRPSILLIHQGHDLYGSGRVLVNSAQMWLERYPKARMTIDLPEKGPLSEQFADDYRVRFGRTWIARKYLFKKGLAHGLNGFGTSLKNAYKDLLENDIVYVNTITPITYLLAAIVSSNRPILHVHEIPSRTVRWVFSLLFAIARPRLVFVSNTTRNSYMVAPWLQCSVVPNSHDGIFVDNKPPPTTKINLLAIGRINPQKGWLVLADALKSLNEADQQRLSVRFVGNTYKNQNHMYDELVANLKDLPQGMVELYPFNADPTSHYEWADITVIPSLVAESFGLVAIEAMAASSAIIASNSGALPEIIPLSAGLITEKGSVEELAEAISQLINDPQRMRAMGKAGHNHSKRYSKSHFMRNLTSATLNWST